MKLEQLLAKHGTAIAIGAAATGYFLLRKPAKGAGSLDALDALIGPAKLKPQRVHGPPPEPEPPAATPDSFWLDKGTRTIARTDSWSCAKAKDQPVPDVSEWVPEVILNAGGPITQAIHLGTNIVRKAFEQIGAKKVCTVTGGHWEQITVVKRQGSPRFWVQINVSMAEPVLDPDAWGGSWTFRDNRSDSGPVTLRVETGGDTGGPKRDYLFNGSKPPPHLWPHVNIARWKASASEAFDRPRVFVARSGDDLELWAWLPPRAPDSHVNHLGQRIVDGPVFWRIDWSVTEES